MDSFVLPEGGVLKLRGLGYVDAVPDVCCGTVRCFALSVVVEELLLI